MVAVVYGHLDVLTELSSVDANIDIQNSVSRFNFRPVTIFLALVLQIP